MPTDDQLYESWRSDRILGNPNYLPNEKSISSDELREGERVIGKINYKTMKVTFNKD